MAPIRRDYPPCMQPERVGRKANFVTCKKNVVELPPTACPLWVKNGLMHCKQLLGPGRARRVHKTLHKHQIEPATEFVSDLSKMCNSLKTEALMKTDRGIVGRVNTSDHHVLSQRKRTRKQSLNKRASHALTAHVIPHVNRVLDCVAVSRPCASPLPEGGKAEHIIVGRTQRDEHRKTY